MTCRVHSSACKTLAQHLGSKFGPDTVEHALSRRALIRAQAKEIARLNGVYNKLLKEAGVTMYGAH